MASPKHSTPTKASSDDYNDYKARRSTQQGVVRGHVTKIVNIMKTRDTLQIVACEQQIYKLKLAMQRFDHVHERLISLCEEYGYDQLDFVSKADILRTDSAQAIVEAHQWIDDMDKMDELSMTVIEKPKSTEFMQYPQSSTRISDVTGAGAELGFGDTSEFQFSSVTEDRYETLLKEKEAQIDDLHGKLDRLSNAEQKAAHLEGQMSQERERARVEAEQSRGLIDSYQSTMDALKAKLQASKQREDQLKNQMTMGTAGASNVTASVPNVNATMSQDDLCALSQLMSQSNVDMLQHVLDHSASQQRQFYHTMNAPKSVLKIFNGDRTEYRAFIMRFEELVGTTERSYTSKLSTLMEHVGTNVMPFLECCNHKTAREGYELALKILRKRFGDPFLIAQAWVDKLLEYPKLKHPEMIMKFLGELTSAVETLSTIGHAAEIQCARVMKQIVAKLPNHIQTRWRKKVCEKADRSEVATIQDMIDIISSSAEEMSHPVYGYESINKTTMELESRGKASAGKRKTTTLMTMTDAPEECDNEIPVMFQDRKNKDKKVKETVRGTFAQNEGTDRVAKCYVCKKEHYTSKCYQFMDLGAQERLLFVEKHKLCILCLYPGHDVNVCKGVFTCQVPGCGERHNTKLHRALNPGDNPLITVRVGAMNGIDEVDDYDDVINEESTIPTMMSNGKLLHWGTFWTDVQVKPHFMLPLLSVVVKGENGRLYATHGLIDTGSAITMCSPVLKHTLGIDSIARAELILQGVNSEKSLQTDVVEFQVRGNLRKDFYSVRTAIVNQDMTMEDVHVNEINRYNSWAHLQHLEIQSHYHTRVELLIGQDNAHLFEQMDKLPGPDMYAPCGVLTRLGWTVFGHRISKNMPLLQPTKVDVKMLSDVSHEANLENMLERMWDLERVPDDSGYSPENKKILKDWDARVVLVEGHFHVPIPFKKEPPMLADNYVPAKARLMSLGRRLLANPQLCEQYCAGMRKSFDIGIAEIAPLIARFGYEWYNPHKEVITERRPGKCRIVQNASFKHRGSSLNESVHQGPNLTTPLVDVMVDFRLYEYVVTGDVENMYNQVMVPEEHRDCLRFLWFEDHDPRRKIVKCRMKTQMFGGGWSAAASIYAFRKTVGMYGSEYDEIVSTTIMRNFYVDDLIKSIVTIAIGIKLIMDLRHILARTGFNLVKFGTNSSQILESIPIENRAAMFKEYRFDDGDEVPDKTLGTGWKPGSDVFCYHVSDERKPLTRRGMLSAYASVYDPLGFVGPFVLVAKMLIQDLCRAGYQWDDPLPDDIEREWLDWLSRLPDLKKVEVPRWLGASDDPDIDYQLHVFCDASEKGYAAVVYFCVLDESGEIVKTNLLFSKVKVSPTKQITIPRLELCAAVLGARMERKMVAALNVRVLPSVFWSDSTVVLHYIKQQARSFKTFVANRVAVIQEISDESQWRHVPGDINPADCASRGCTVDQMLHAGLWLQGPEFLKKRSEWPTRPEFEISADFERYLEVKRICRVRVSKAELLLDDEKENLSVFIPFIEHYSDWNRIVRAMAFLRRCARWTVRRETILGVITSEEAQRAEIQLFRIAQRVFLTPEQRKSKIFLKLFPFEENKLWRVGGRLMMSHLRYEEKYPVVLPRSRLSEMYIRYVHIRQGHPGVDRTFYEVRRKCWLLGGKSQVKPVVAKCVLCQKMRKQGIQQQMAPLPELRLNTGAVPFETVGVDYFGPIMVKRGRSLVKYWGCVITCFQMRAVHIELADDLSTSAFLNALQRFIARRGRPVTIVSDNGSNFIGAAREIKELIGKWNEGHIQEQLAQQHITWQFNTPTASHHGGIWERQIRTIREYWMALTREQVLTADQLHTLLCNIEHMINSRPLTKITEDSQDLLPLTPLHLLNLHNHEGLITDFTSADGYRQRWKQVLYLSDQFWKKWLASYLRSLQERSKWLGITRNLKVGDLLLCVTPNVARMKWPLAIVLKEFAGKDGLVRSVQIKTRNGVYERPVSKLVYLEV